MPLWQRLLVTLVTMVLTSFFAGLRGSFKKRRHRSVQLAARKIRA